ncbi:MAG: CDP-diacylglycerol--glycerol-3-phosphate 3-phosphatidyltransferase [Elusimicrobia bacterium HGW-Elusimicrobia-3]|nr:MAG: CDP-diacylglycerol--glycerol-3-phosphate 3-phosphatidyltransferase [Elusimicrobia bacterium HGW-Elusimicrobia-3]
MTLANRITMGRMGLSLAIFALILSQTFWTEIAALFLLTIASISDGVDGAIARRTQTTTSFGAIADPFADKLLVMAVFLAFASIKELSVPLWAVFLILLRELTISTLRVLAALHGEVMKAEAAGKIKTTIQLITAFTIMLLLVLIVWARKHGLPAPLAEIVGLAKPISWWLTVTTAFFTIISGAIYLYNHRALLYKSWSERGRQP